jgi:hypothetical protein
MIELALVVGFLVLLVGGGALLALTPWWWIFGAGLALIALGLVVSIPAGAYYHLLLYRAVGATRLPRNWWLFPTRSHALVPDGARPRMLLWFKIGAAGFGAAILGCILFAVGALRS